MRNYQEELEKRIAYIQEILANSGAKGIVYGNSGGKDSALVGILCKKACNNVLGVIMPCGSRRNYEEDRRDATEVAEKFNISFTVVDLTPVKEMLVKAVSEAEQLSDMAKANMSPRLRMATLYSIAHTRSSLVAGTGNRSEAHMGYFTKWGDGAYDFNPIADLTVTEIYEFLKFLDAPDSVIKKAPSAALFEGQTDEGEMGVTYKEIDTYLLEGVKGENYSKIEKAHKSSAHKRNPQHNYPL